MRLHLRMDQGRNLSLMEQQDVADLFFILEVGPQVGHDLPRELVEQVRLLVVAHVVEVDETAHDVVLESLLGVPPFEGPDDLPRVAYQVLHQNLVRDRRQMK